MNFTVILADDEAQILEGIHRGIDWDALGFEVIATASNGKELLERTETLRPDLVISDIKMPFLDGLQVAKMLHDNMMHVKIVLFSGWDDFEYAQLAIRYGVSEYILKPIDFQEFQQRSSRTRLEQLYQESLPLLQEQVLIQLVSSNSSLEQLEKQMQTLSLDLHAAWYGMVLIKAAGDSADFLSQVSMTESVKEMLEHVCRFVSFRYLDKIAYLLLLSDQGQLPQILKSLSEAAHLAKHYGQVSFSCGVGMPCESLEQLPVSFAQATEALEYSLVSAEETVMVYQDIAPYGNNVYTTLNTDALETAIKQEDQKKVDAEVQKLLEQLEKSHYHFNAYQSAILEIIFALSGIFRQYHMMDDEIFADAKRMTTKVLSLETGEQLNAWLLNYCHYISYAIHRRKVDHNSLLAQKAMEYVEQHYGDADLSVETVCNYLHVSMSHFSNLFRKETDMSFLVYLTKKRMEEAVRLLKTTDYKSRVIGEMVGYPEPNYFSYVFKKNMQVSPANFRKSLQQEAPHA